MASAEEYASWIVANKDKQGTPEFETVAKAYQVAKAQAQPAQTPLEQKPDAALSKPPLPEEGMTQTDKVLAKIHIPDSVNSFLDRARGVFMGAADPVVGGAQLLANMAGQGGGINKSVAEREKYYDLTRKIRGSEGFDAYRLGGNVVSPVNLIPAGYLSKAKTMVDLAKRGVVVGAAVGAAQPVTENADNTGDFVTTKAMQAGGGAASGLVLTPAVAKAAGALANGVNSLVQRFKTMPEAQAKAQAESLLNSILNKDGSESSGIAPDNFSPDILKQITDALKAGKTVDPEQLVRSADFASLGIKPTVGQVTRDPMQFALERNLRGVDTGGGKNALADRFSEQGNALRKIFAEANSAQDPYPAGNSLIAMLKGADAPKKAAVNAAYESAKDTSGRYANIDVPAFSKMANDALDESMLGRFLPNEAKSLLNDISTGKTPLNVNTQAQIDSVLSSAQRGAKRGGNDAAALAIGKVRDALHQSPIESSAGVEAKAAFDTARGLARDRFATIEKTPALKAAIEGTDPDQFIKNHIINATTDETKALLSVVDSSPDAKSLIRSQVAEHLRGKAFGSDLSGDAPFAAESFNKSLKTIGRDKLEALFGKEDAEKLFTAGRVMSYIKTQPEGSAVNNSNTAGAVMNLLSKAMSSPGLNILRNSFRTYMDEKAVNSALNPIVKATTKPVDPSVANKLRKIVGIVPSASAGISSN